LSASIGDDIVIRDVRNGVVYFAWPIRVVGADADRLLVAQRPGALGRVLRGYPEDPASVRSQLQSGRPELVERAWASTVTLGVAEAGSHWFTRLFWDASTGDFLCYYVDFVRPLVFQGHSIDLSDLELDIVVGADGAWSYKDQESYEHLRLIGWVTPADHAAIENAKPEVIDAIESRRFPFDGTLMSWEWPEGLATPVLPTGWDR
jgi:hypothetical protein